MVAKREAGEEQNSSMKMFRMAKHKEFEKRKAKQ